MMYEFRVHLDIWYGIFIDAFQSSGRCSVPFFHDDHFTVALGIGLCRFSRWVRCNLDADLDSDTCLAGFSRYSRN